MSGGFTIIQYGDITLYHVTTEEVKQDLVFDESNTDMLYVRTTIRVSGFLHGHDDWNYQVQDDGTGNTYRGSATLAELQLRRRLEPRGRFIMTTGCSAANNGQIADGFAMFDISPMPTSLTPPNSNNDGNISLIGYDLNNGPKNLNFSIKKIAGDEMFRINATFELCHLECPYEPGDDENNYGVLSNRWSCVDSIDTNLQTVRTYTGQLVCATQNINAQSFRWMTVPTLQPLFRIESMNFEVSADGLKLNWVIVHREVAAAAPWPARTWSVIHRETRSDGLRSSVSVDVDLTGDSGVDKGRLIQLAYWIIFAKTFGQSPQQIAQLSINPDGQAPAGSSPQSRFLFPYVVKEITFTDYIGDVNRISATATMLRQSADQQTDVIIAFNNLGTSIDSDRLPPPEGTEPPYNQSYSWGAYAGQVPEFQGPANLAGIFSCFLQTPCDNRHSLYVAPGRNRTFTTFSVDSPDDPTPPAEDPEAIPSYVTIVPEVEDFPDYYSDSQETALYTYWQIDNIYRINGMTVQMPIATPYTPGVPDYSPSSSMIKLSRDQAVRIIRVSAERSGAEPEFPDPNTLPDFIIPEGLSADQAIKQTFLKMKLRPGTPTITVLGQKLFRAAAEYYIGLSRAPKPGEQLALGNDKWTNFGNQNTQSDGGLDGGALTSADWS